MTNLESKHADPEDVEERFIVINLKQIFLSEIF